MWDHEFQPLLLENREVSEFASPKLDITVGIRDVYFLR